LSSDDNSLSLVARREGYRIPALESKQKSGEGDADPATFILFWTKPTDAAKLEGYGIGDACL